MNNTDPWQAINWEKTEQNYGLKKSDYIPASAKNHVWVKCQNPECTSEHKERLLEYCYAVKKIKKALKEEKPFLCQTCSHAHRKGQVQPPRAKTDLPLPPEVNVEKTLADPSLGYDPMTLKSWSRKEIILTCGCGRDCYVKRAQLNKYKSVVETGHFKCVACWTKERRTGVKVSAETKEKMKQSQKIRRQKKKKPSVEAPSVFHNEEVQK